MNIQAIELRLVHLPLRAPFRSPLGSEAARDAIVVRVGSDRGEGWGECVAGADPLYSSEYVDSAWLTMRRYLAPKLLATADLSATDVPRLLGEVKGHRMAKAALEMGVLDAQLQLLGVSFAEFLGGVRDTVAPGVVVGITSSLAELLDTVAEHVHQGYARVKLKIEPGWDLVPVAAVRERFGSDLRLQVDANCSYERADMELLARLEEFSLALIEQPFGSDDLLSHAELARRIATPVCLDESIVSAKSAANAIALGACSVVNIKPGRVGGYLEARAVHDLCQSMDVPVWCGGMLETGLGRAANLALASLPGFTLPGDISATDRYFDEDITAPFVLQDGTIAVPRAPGLGVEVRHDVLDAHTNRLEAITVDAS
ncbi:MAG: o-succinylbenzoate synthase [Acidimicrobiales bacterium]